MDFLRSFLRRHLAGKPVVASPNVDCFLRLLNYWHNFRVWALRVAYYATFASAIYQSLSHSRGRFNLVHDKRDTLGRGWELMYGGCFLLDFGCFRAPFSQTHSENRKRLRIEFHTLFSRLQKFFLVSQSAFNTEFHR